MYNMLTTRLWFKIKVIQFIISDTILLGLLSFRQTLSLTR